MLSATYGEIRNELAAEGAFRVSNLKGALTAIVEFIVFGLGCVYLSRTSGPRQPGYWVVELLMGTSLYRMFVILHEAGHKTLFTKKWVNSLVGSLASPFCLVPYIPWRNIHLLHHKWVGVIDKDPTQAHLLKLRSLTTTERFLFRVFWKLFVPIPFVKFMFDVFWGYPIREYRRGNVVDARQGAFSVLICALPHVGLLVLLGPIRYLTVFGPMIVVFYVIFELVNLPQHSGMFPYTSSEHPSSIPVREQDEITRTTYLPKLMAVLFSYNFNLHTEHHLFPTIPWYSLPKVTDKVLEMQDCTYNIVDMLCFAYELRRQDPIELYVNSLPGGTVKLEGHEVSS